ncbi:MAG: hypothetical protein AAFX02_04265 [Pseudomonadota bacterium]
MGEIQKGSFSKRHAERGSQGISFWPAPAIQDLRPNKQSKFAACPGHPPHQPSHEVHKGLFISFKDATWDNRLYPEERRDRRDDPFNIISIRDCLTVAMCQKLVYLPQAEQCLVKLSILDLKITPKKATNFHLFQPLGAIIDPLGLAQSRL